MSLRIDRRDLDLAAGIALALIAFGTWAFVGGALNRLCWGLVALWCLWGFLWPYDDGSGRP